MLPREQVPPCKRSRRTNIRAARHLLESKTSDWLRQVVKREFTVLNSSSNRLSVSSLIGCGFDARNVAGV